MTRREALSTGTKHYDGRPCKNCGNSYRSTDNGCTVCARQKSKQWALRNPLQRQAMLGAWYSKNVESKRSKSREWNKAHPESHRLLNARWAAKHCEQSNQTKKKCADANPELYRHTQRLNKFKRRALLASAGTYTFEEWQFVQDIYGNRCANPECSNPTAPLTVDHVVPISVGGSNLIGNIQPLCLKCNNLKRVKTIRYPISVGGRLGRSTL